MFPIVYHEHNVAIHIEWMNRQVIFKGDEMNTRVVLLLAVVMICALALFCSSRFAPEDLTLIDAGQIDDIQWNLVDVDPPAAGGDVEDYAPFMIALLDGAIWGHDGCNFLSGKYEIIHDTLFVREWSVTEMGCSGQRNVPFSHLLAKPGIAKKGNMLTLQKDGTTWSYSSNFTRELPATAFINSTLTLRSSNDADFAFFIDLGLYPQLQLGDNREFSLQWYNKSPQVTGFINEYAGIFGMNDQNEIQFTAISWKYEGNQTSTVDWQVIERILAAGRYEEGDGIFKITNDDASTCYEFSR
ncbi:MAG: META domain-containing protein [Calditrichaeota bacterium]|nr:MAG: META domain-containing protein [Calditrichota bacterium]